jgi:hypothetical protein
VVEYILRLHKVLGLIPCTENKSVLFVAMLTHYSLPAIGRLRQEDHKIKACLGEELISLEVFSACSTVPDGHLQLGVFTSLPVFMLLHFCLYPPPVPHTAFPAVFKCAIPIGSCALSSFFFKFGYKVSSFLATGLNPSIFLLHQRSIWICGMVSLDLEYTISFFFYLFFYYSCTGVQCDICKSSYNISYLNSPSPPFSIQNSPILGIVSTDLIFTFTYMCT